MSHCCGIKNFRLEKVKASELPWMPPVIWWRAKCANCGSESKLADTENEAVLLRFDDALAPEDPFKTEEVLESKYFKR